MVMGAKLVPYDLFALGSSVESPSRGEGEGMGAVNWSRLFGHCGAPSPVSAKRFEAKVTLRVIGGHAVRGANWHLEVRRTVGGDAWDTWRADR